MCFVAFFKLLPSSASLYCAFGVVLYFFMHFYSNSLILHYLQKLFSTQLFATLRSAGLSYSFDDPFHRQKMQIHKITLAFRFCEIPSLDAKCVYTISMLIIFCLFVMRKECFSNPVLRATQKQTRKIG